MDVWNLNVLTFPSLGYPVCHMCQFHITLGKRLAKISKPLSYFILIRSYDIHVRVFLCLVYLLFVFRKSSSSTSSGPQSATPGEEKNFFSQFLLATPNGSGSNSSCNSQDNHSNKVITALLWLEVWQDGHQMPNCVGLVVSSPHVHWIAGASSSTPLPVKE